MTPQAYETLQIEQNDLVIFADDGQFYLVTEKAYKASPLPESLWAAPEFVVGLGAVAADLKFFPPTIDGKENGGKIDLLHELLTKEISCVVLNLASLINDREKNGKPRIDPRPRLYSRNSDGSLPSTVAQAPTVDEKDIVIFDSRGDFYWVKYGDHLDPMRCPSLAMELTSAPMLAAALGTVVADIPFLPTVGCSCVLLNLALLRQGRKAAAAKLYEARARVEKEDDKVRQEFKSTIAAAHEPPSGHA